MRILIIFVLCFLIGGCSFFYPEYANQKANNDQVAQLKRIANALEQIARGK